MIIRMKLNLEELKKHYESVEHLIAHIRTLELCLLDHSTFSTGPGKNTDKNTGTRTGSNGKVKEEIAEKTDASLVKASADAMMLLHFELQNRGAHECEITITMCMQEDGNKLVFMNSKKKPAVRYSSEETQKHSTEKKQDQEQACQGQSYVPVHFNLAEPAVFMCEVKLRFRLAELGCGSLGFPTIWAELRNIPPSLDPFLESSSLTLAGETSAAKTEQDASRNKGHFNGGYGVHHGTERLQIRMYHIAHHGTFTDLISRPFLNMSLSKELFMKTFVLEVENSPPTARAGTTVQQGQQTREHPIENIEQSHRKYVVESREQMHGQGATTFNSNTNATLKQEQQKYANIEHWARHPPASLENVDRKIGSFQFRINVSLLPPKMLLSPCIKLFVGMQLNKMDMVLFFQNILAALGSDMQHFAANMPPTCTSTSLHSEATLRADKYTIESRTTSNIYK